MRIGAVGMNPYVYNTNSVNASSMNRIQGIGSDLTASKSDFSGLTSEDIGENINPLRPGETKNFVDIMEMQMQMGRMNASRVMDASPFEQ